MTLLNSNGLTPFSNRKNALIVIMGEKEILRFYIQLSEIAADLFARDVEDMMSTVKSTFNGDDDVSRYVRSTAYALRNSSKTFFESDDDNF